MALKLIQNMKNGRSLQGQDLVNLFLVVDRYHILDQVRQVLVNVAPNLMTINHNQIQLKYGDDVQDSKFLKEEETRKLLELEQKKIIFNKYQGIYNSEPQLLHAKEIGLAPLSSVMADLFDEFNDQQILLCLQMLGSEKVENYSEEFIKKLYERYSQPSQFENLMKTNSRFFYDFAKHWPHFLKNSAIVNQLLQNKASRVLVTEQSETLQILAHKNVLHPELIETHFDTFIKMKDRDQVAGYMKTFLETCAYLGYAQFDISKLTQVFRRIHKSPDQIDISQLLDYYILLALSNVYYKDFDEKSVAFVEEGLELIEKKFTGIETFEFEEIDPISKEKERVKMNYYRSIPTTSKIYNKVLIRGKAPILDFKKVIAEHEALLESSDEEGDVQAQLKEQVIIEEEEEDIEEADLPKVNIQEEILKVSENIDETVEIEKLDDEQALKYQSVGGEQNFVISEEQNEMQQGKTEKIAKIAHKQDKRIYERKASESRYSEELEFHQYRKKKLQDMDKKAKHLLLFSNINQLNFVDINKQDIVKAWTILFHFKSKSFDSIIYDEFESITMRNAIGKSKGHELFTKFYMRMIEKSYDHGFKLNLTNKCEKTGWPMDITISHLNSEQKKKIALYFFLQEEVCLNAKTNEEEPLALQKLMIKHLSSISDYKVEYITENNFYGSKHQINPFIDTILQQKLNVL